MVLNHPLRYLPHIREDEQGIRNSTIHLESSLRVFLHLLDGTFVALELRIDYQTVDSEKDILSLDYMLNFAVLRPRRQRNKGSDKAQYESYVCQQSFQFHTTVLHRTNNHNLHIHQNRVNLPPLKFLNQPYKWLKENERRRSMGMRK